MIREVDVNDRTLSEIFWEEQYRDASPATSGRPGAALARFAWDLPPGYALDLGCGKDDDALWLARRG